MRLRSCPVSGVFYGSSHSIGSTRNNQWGFNESSKKTSSSIGIEAYSPCAHVWFLGATTSPETQQNHGDVGGNTGIHGPGASRGPSVQQICRFVCLWDTFVGGEAEKRCAMNAQSILRSTCTYGFGSVPCDSPGNTTTGSPTPPFKLAWPYF